MLYLTLAKKKFLLGYKNIFSFFLPPGSAFFIHGYFLFNLINIIVFSILGLSKFIHCISIPLIHHWIICLILYLFVSTVKETLATKKERTLQGYTILLNNEISLRVLLRINTAKLPQLRIGRV